MEINSLVIVGISMILISIFLTVYLRKGAVREWIIHQLEDKDYSEEKKKEF